MTGCWSDEIPLLQVKRCMSDEKMTRRVIFLVDMNAFYISCEVSRNPDLRGKPAAVAGDPRRRSGIILSASYEARAFGVKTTMLIHEAVRLCPALVLVPPDHDFYEKKSRQVMDLLRRYTPILEQSSVDEAWLDMTGSESLFGQPAEAARKIMDEISARLGLWCSIGISENKFLAKMASEMKKPQGITELWPSDVPQKLWPLPVSAIYGVGRQTAVKLASLGLSKIGDLAQVDENFLVSLLGKMGSELYRHARGLDYEPVMAPAEDSMKSIGRSTTLPRDICQLNQAELILMELAEDVGSSARRHGRKGHTIQITLKYSDFKVITRQMPLPATSATQDIYHASRKLLEQHWDPEKPVRLIGISLSNFEPDAGERQLSLFETQTSQAAGEKKDRLDQAIDQIRAKLGEKSVTRGKLIKKDKTS
jgi:DNA polymerase IV